MELQRRKKRNLFKIPAMVFLGTVVIGLVVIFGLFHIRQVDVVGNEFYSSTEIQKMVMTGSLSENSIYLTWKYSDAQTASSLPFLSAVEVTMVNPWHVQIRVYEKTIAGYLMYSGSRVYFDIDGNVVEISGEERESIPPFSGIAIGTPTVGESLPVEDTAFLSSIIEASRLIRQSGLVPDEVHYDDDQELILYFGEVRVLLGDDSNLEEKFTELQALYPQLDGLSGTLHMEDYTPTTTTISFKKGERGAEEEELIINLNKTVEEETSADGTAETDADGTVSETDADAAQSESSASGYVEDSSRFSTDSDGNEIYTDEQGNVTTNLDKPYLGDDGEIITDGYGYIDPYTGAYILN